MTQTIQAVFEGGVFRPCTPILVPDGEQVTLTFDFPSPIARIPNWPDLPPELAADANDVIVARGTRIDLTLILRHHFQGASWPAVAEEFPTVGASDWPAIIRYVELNQEPLRAYWKQEEKKLDELRRSSSSGLTLEVLRDRAEKKSGKPFPRLNA